MKTKRFPITVSLTVIVLILALLGSHQTAISGEAVPAAVEASPVGTAFTYQGQLKREGIHYDGTCDFQYSLWDAPSDGTQFGTTLTKLNVSVNEGFLAVQLDWGADAFQAHARWLEISVRCPAGAGDYTLLTPRQPLTPTPYALYAQGAWRTTGNAGTTPGTNYLGTSDNVALELKVNGDRVLRLEPNATSPNLIGGHNWNSVTNGVYGATIGGGGGEYGHLVTDAYGTVGGGGTNRAGDDAGTVEDAPYATVGGGEGNFASGGWTTVSGGAHNDAVSPWSTVGGGRGNLASGEEATVGGGNNNTASGEQATVGGGFRNIASGTYASSGGGQYNTAGGPEAIVAGGSNNTASGNHAAIGGGSGNTADGEWSATIAGGSDNTASGNFSAVGGGEGNTAGSSKATVAGGDRNTASNPGSTVAGGQENTASGDWATVGGGSGNIASGMSNTIAGGTDNAASGNFSAIGGGYSNTASGEDATVGGGYSNTADGYRATIGGGYSNTASGEDATVGGGSSNTASGELGPTVAGGQQNTASGEKATVSGGQSNTANGDRATVGGGSGNIASGDSATVPGGSYNLAQGSSSFAAGTQAKAYNSGCFVWADSIAADLACDVDNRWVARAGGGVYFYTDGGLSNGVYVAAGGNSWNGVSDRATKENFIPADGQAILDTLASLPVQEYNLKSQDPSIRHIGPVAQDFAAFGYGESDTAINMQDADGVALAAIQGLYQQVQALEAENADLEARVAALEAAAGSGASARPWEWGLLPGLGLLAFGLVWVARRGGDR